MSRIEKLILTVLLVSVTFSATLFGVWKDKTLLLAPLLSLVYLSIAVGMLAFVSRGVRRKEMLTIPPGGIPLLLFWLYSAVMIPFSILPYEAKISTLFSGCYLGTYWAVANVLSRFPRRKTVWTAVFAVLVFVALYSLVQHKVAPGRIFGMERYTNYWEGGRLGGTYQCPNHIAHLFQMWLPFCMVFLFIPQFGWFWRICFAYALPLFCVLIYQTQSRAGILGAVAGAGMTALLLIFRKSRRAFYIALLVVPLLGAGAVGGLWFGSSMFRTRMMPVVKFVGHITSGAVVEEEFNDFRPQTWLDTIDMIKHRPFFGAGPGNYGLTYEDYRTRWQGLRRETVHPHNEYLELLAEYGVFGSLLVLWVLVSVVWSLLHLIRTAERAYHALPAVALLGAMAGTAVHGFFDFELHNFPNAMMLSFLAGCVAAPLTRQSAEKVSRATSWTGWVFAGIFALAAGFAVQSMCSAWIRVRGEQFLAEQKFESAKKRFTAAWQLDSQNWPAQLGLGQIYYHYRYYELNPSRKQEWAQKEFQAYTDAYRVNNKKEEVVFGLGRVELFLGHQDQGLNHLRQAAHYKRFNDFYWRKLGIELRKAGLYDEARSAFEYAQKLDRSNATVNRNIQWLKTRVKP